MERFFAKIAENHAFLSKEDGHHLLNVMRAKKGEKIEVVDEGDLYLCEVSSISPLEVLVLNEINRPTELNVHLILGFALLKGGHDELVLMKGTELGVSSFLPFISERTIIRLDSKERKKREERFQKIVSNASSQSKRLITPEVLPILDYKNIFDIPADHRYLAYENLSGEPFHLVEEFSSFKAGERVLCLVGPEGGFSKNEAGLAIEKGFKPVSLGKRILRAETASIYLSSVFSLLEENK